jgi:hypothetical protein
MNKTYNFSIIFIILFRCFDLISTKLAVSNFETQEQNLFVKLFGLNIFQFFIIEVFFIFILVIIFIYYKNNENLLIIKSTNFKNYVNFYFFNKSTSNIIDWFFRIKLKNTIVLFGSIVKDFIVVTSSIFVLNNIWVYLCKINNKIAIKYYYIFDSYNFFTFIIFVFPVLFLFLLILNKLYKSFLLNKNI